MLWLLQTAISWCTYTTLLVLATLGNTSQINAICVMPPRLAKASRGGGLNNAPKSQPFLLKNFVKAESKKK
jgi:hypothetical protein